jgi:hypothetical protein
MQNPNHVSSLSRARQGARRSGRRAGLLAMVLAIGSLPFGSACTKVQNDNSSSYLIVAALEAAPGAEPAKMGGFLESDVITNGGGVFEDGGQVTFKLGLKDPGTPDTPTKPTSANFITVTGYKVEYRMAGDTTVLASFTGAMTVTVNDIGGVGALVVAPADMKIATFRPLVATLGEVKTIATVTFTGRDQAGRSVSISSTISVNFANWADPA